MHCDWACDTVTSGLLSFSDLATYADGKKRLMEALTRGERGGGPILFVIDNLEFGGGERGFLQIIQTLVREGWQVSVASHPGGVFEDEVRESGAAFLPLNMESRLGLRTIFHLRRIIRRGGFCIVHSQGTRADFFSRVSSLGVGRARNVCTVQMPIEGFDVAQSRKALYQSLDRLSACQVDRFIVVSEALKKQLIEGRGIDPGKVRLIYNGVETESCALVEYGACSGSGFLRDERLIGAVGRLVWQKGFEYLIRAMPHVLHRVAEARLVIAGEGPLRGELQELAQECGLEGKVVFQGFRRDIREFLRAVELVVIPSVREGFPMITLEAMAMAKPIVATAIDGIIEQIDHNVDGLLVPPADCEALGTAIVTLLEDHVTCERLGQAARQKTATRFDVRKMVNEMKLVYAELLGQT